MTNDFRFEQEMMPAIIDALPGIFESHSPVMWTSEFAKGYRIIDVIAACVSDPRTVMPDWQDVAIALRRLTQPQMMVLAEIARRQKATPDYLARFAWLPVSEIKDQYIGAFLRLGIIKKISRRSYGVAPALAWMPEKTISIEAKLSDWRDALDQALYNKPFVDYSYVALPLNAFVMRTDVLGIFARHGIGVLGVTKHSGAEVLIEPRQRPVDRADYHITSLRILAGILSSSPKWECLAPKAGNGIDEPVQSVVNA